MDLEKSVRELLCSVATDEADIISVNSDVNLMETNIIDSISLALFISLLEEKFDFEVEAEDVVPSNFATIQNIVNYVGGRSHG